MPGVNTALARRRKNLRREFDAIVAGDRAWTEFIPRKVFPERLRSRADEIAELREINSHLPFAHPIQRWYEPIVFAGARDSIDTLQLKVRNYYGALVRDPGKIVGITYPLA